MKSEPDLAWYSVRCVFIDESDGQEHHTYEERITLWQATSAETAIELAEQEAIDYTAALDDGVSSSRYLGLAQSYRITDDVGSGAEIFSLMRDSQLGPDEYLTRFFDTGSERRTQIDE